MTDENGVRFSVKEFVAHEMNSLHAALGRIEGKVETSMRDMRAELYALSARVAQLEVRDTQLEARDTARKYVTGLTVTVLGLVFGVVGYVVGHL